MLVVPVIFVVVLKLQQVGTGLGSASVERPQRVAGEQSPAVLQHPLAIGYVLRSDDSKTLDLPGIHHPEFELTAGLPFPHPRIV